LIIGQVYAFGSYLLSASSKCGYVSLMFSILLIKGKKQDWVVAQG
jgi:hypothetical protein